MEVLGDNLNSIAVLIDQENVYSAKISIGQMMDMIAARGRIAIKRAYGDWGRFSAAKRELLTLGIDLVELPSLPRGKNRADIRLVVDAMELALTKEHINTFVLVTGDSDFIQLSAKLRELNRQVVFIAREESASSLLSESCDELIYLPKLLTTTKTRKSASAKKSINKSNSQQDAPLKAETTSRKKGASTCTLIQFSENDLDSIAWTLSYLNSIAAKKHKDEFFLLSQFQHAINSIFPGFDIAKFGFPKNGRWVKMIQGLEQDGWIEIDFDSEKRLYHLKPTSRLTDRIANASPVDRIDELLSERKKRAELVRKAVLKPASKKIAAKAEESKAEVFVSDQLFELASIQDRPLHITNNVEQAKAKPVLKKPPKQTSTVRKKSPVVCNQLPLPFTE